MSFDKCVYPKDHHPNQDREHFLHPKIFPMPFPSQPWIIFFNVSQLSSTCNVPGFTEALDKSCLTEASGTW